MKKFLFFALFLGLSLPLLAQITVQGTVKSGTDGATLPGVSILVKGTLTGTTTDINGHYSINVPKNGVLVFSYVGYKTQDIPVNGRTTINVTMRPTALGLNELVVVGYGTQKKELVTGSVSTVSSSTIDKLPITRVDQALQGTASGVTVTPSSGAPGAEPTILIRGVTSINNSSPLIIVDGTIMNGGLNYLNPNDIASVTVLKDAASAAIYGTRAANGVILITTKSGRKNSPLRVNFNMQIGYQNAIKKVKLTNATQYMELRNISVMNDGKAPVFTLDQIKSAGVGTNWQNELFSTAPYQSYNVNLSGGSDKATYYASVGYIDQKGIVQPSIAYDKKLSLSIRSTYNVSKYVTVGQYLAYTYEKNNTGLNTNSEFGGPLNSALNLDPLTPVYVSAAVGATYPKYALMAGNGMYYGISKYVGQEMTNPLAYLQTQLGNYGYSDNMVGNAYIDIHPIKGLSFKSQINVKRAYWGYNSFTPLYYLNANNFNINQTVQYRYIDHNMTWNWDNTAKYEKTIGKNFFSVLLGTSAMKQTGFGLNVTYQGEPVTNYQDASFNWPVPIKQRIGGGYDQQVYTLSSMFGRVTYNYDQKYLFTGIIRRDGSSKFGTNNHYGVFPSAQLGWVVNREKFFKQNKVLTNLKLRVSYGVVGNDMSLAPFQYESVIAGGGGFDYVFGNDALAVGYATNAPSNPNLKWEQTSSFDAGFDAIFFGSLSVTFDYYSKKTTGMLETVQIPGYAGYSAEPWANVGDMTNKGIGIVINYNTTIAKDLHVSVQGNFSYNKNEVTYLGEGKQYLNGGATFQNSLYPLTRTAVGLPYRSFYGFQELGVFHSWAEINNYRNSSGALIQPNAVPGDFKWADLNGDGKISQADRKFLGNTIPPYSYGLTINLTYKNWDFSAFGQGVWGNKIFQGYRRLDIITANYPISALNTWTVNNPNSNYPRLSDSDPNHNFSYPSNFYLQNGAYFRLKNLQLGYSLPENLIRIIGFQKFRVFASVSNLFTLTKYTGYDPEVGGANFGIDYGIYPQSRTFMFGVNIGM